MIVYKNIFPKDFSELQNNQGFLYSLFNEKEVRRSEKLTKIDSEKLHLENKLRKIQSEHIQDEIELYGTILKFQMGERLSVSMTNFKMSLLLIMILFLKCWWKEVVSSPMWILMMLTVM